MVGKERHLLDCKVRSRTSGVKAPSPRAERAASLKTYSVLGFRPSTVNEVVGSKFFSTWDGRGEGEEEKK